MSTTPEAISILQADCTAGVLAEVTARKLGPPWTARRIWTARFKLGIKPDTNVTEAPPHRTPVRLDKATKAAGLERIKAGEPVENVCADLGVSRTYFAKCIREAGLKCQQKAVDRRKVWTGEEDALVADLWRSKVKASEIAARMGKTKEVIENRIHVLGIRKTEKRAPAQAKPDGRTCNLCRVHKPATSFARIKETGQLYGRCKECRNRASTQVRHGVAALPGDLCAICQAPAEAVDHLHGDEQVGKRHHHDQVRGLLCHRCNTGLGLYGDLPGRLELAALYLESPGTGRLCPVGQASPGGASYTHEGHLKARYGLTLEDFQAMVEDQGGCKLCGEGLDLVNLKSGSGAVVDHSKDTLEVRGILHSNCNVGLGVFQEDPGLLRRAAQYLRNPPGAPKHRVCITPRVRQAVEQFLVGFEQVAPQEAPLGVLAHLLGDRVVFAVVDPQVHNVDTMANHGVARSGFCRLLTDWIEEVSAGEGPRVVVVLPDRLTPALRSSLLYAVGAPMETLNARECEVRAVAREVAEEFLDDHHLQGRCRSIHYLGLHQGDRLVALMSFTTPERLRASGEVDWVLQRYCTLAGTRVRGGAGKLLSGFRRDHPGSILTFSDASYAHGGLYSSLGFQDGGVVSDYDYVYWRDGRQYHKSAKQLPDLYREAAGKPGLSTEERCTEAILAHRLGYLRVYLPGKRRWILQGAPLAAPLDPARIPA